MPLQAKTSHFAIFLFCDASLSTLRLKDEWSYIRIFIAAICCGAFWLDWSCKGKPNCNALCDDCYFVVCLFFRCTNNNRIKLFMKFQGVYDDPNCKCSNWEYVDQCGEDCRQLRWRNCEPDGCASEDESVPCCEYICNCVPCCEYICVPCCE